MEQDITTDLSVLESHLDGMLDRVHHNSLTLKRLQSFEMRLLALTSLAEMVRFILVETKELFDLDTISLCLSDPKGEIEGLLANDKSSCQNLDSLILIKDDHLFQRYFVAQGRPLLGVYQAENYTEFFGELTRKPASVILAPLMRRGKCLGSLNLGSRYADRFIRNMATDFVEHLASVVSICLENTLNFETLRLTSLVDPLTNVNNRRFLEQRIEEELDRSLRSGDPLSCLFLDIDFFKSINDQHGHQAGDQVLASVACAIKRQLRSNDVLARYGGEEFVALMSQSNIDSAGEIAERIRACVAALPISYNGVTIPVTLSIGSATFHAERSKVHRPVAEIASQLLQHADDALYRAKRGGRNRVESHGLI